MTLGLTERVCATCALTRVTTSSCHTGSALPALVTALAAGTYNTHTLHVALCLADSLRSLESAALTSPMCSDKVTKLPPGLTPLT